MKGGARDCGHRVSPCAESVVDLGNAPTAAVTKDGTGTPPAPSAGSARPAYTPTPAPSSSGAYDLSLLPIVDPSRYEMLEEIGRGGLGRVMRAYDRRLQRVVAVKEMLDWGLTARFVHEAVATAGLEHPGIIPVHDAGRWPSGEPFYAMKLVSGRSLGEVIVEKRSLAERLALLPNVIAIADAMAYAHDRQLVHRDLKPANVLVGAFGETVIIDWGIAKSLSHPPPPPSASPAVATEARESGELTVDGAVLGTPAYMPPEQAAGREVDRRTDVYAIGGILYHVLTGKPPHDTSSEDAMQRILAGDPIPLEEREPSVAPDLLTIVKKAMARDPQARYPTAKELADDLRRFHAGQLVRAHEYTAIALVRRWVRQHSAIVVLSGVLGIALLVVGGVSIHRVIRAREVAEAAQERAEEATRTAVSRTNALLLEQARALLEADPTAALAVLETYPDDGAGVEGLARLASDAWSRGVARQVLRAGGEVQRVAFAPDGRWVAGAAGDAVVSLWDVATGSERRLLGQEGEATLLAVSPDGRWVVSAGPLSKRIHVWDATTGEARALEGHDDGVRWIGLSDDGVLASTSRDLTMRVWSLATGEGRVLVRFHAMNDSGRAAIARDGRTIAYGGLGRVRVIDVATGAERALPDTEVGTGVLAFSRDGRTLVSGGMDGGVRAWDLASGRVRVMRGHKSWVSDAVLSPDAKVLVTAAGEGVAWLWNLETGEGRVLTAAVGDVRAAAFAPDGARFALGGDDRLVRVWDARSLTVRILRGHAAPIASLAFSPDGRTLASASLDKSVRIWDLAAGDRRAIAVPEGETVGHFFADDGVHVALARSVGRNGGVVMADARTGAARILAVGEGPFPDDVVRAPDGAELGAPERGLRRFVTDGGVCGYGRRVHELHACEYARDGSAIAWGGLDKVVHLYEPATDVTRQLGHHDGTVLRIAFSPDGRTLASGGTDRAVRVWDRATGAERVLRGHDGDVEDVAFTADGAKLGSVSMDGSLRLWDLATGEARVYRGDQQAPRSLAFTPDARFAVVGERSGAVREWELATGRARVVLRHDAFVRSLGVAPDGKTVLSNGGDGSSWLWDLGAVPAFTSDVRALRAWMRDVTKAEMSAAGDVATPAR